MKLSLWCCKPELAQTHKGNCIKFVHLCFLILCSKTLQTANELTYEVLHNSPISSQWSISELLTEKSHDLRPYMICGIRVPIYIFASICRRKISFLLLLLMMLCRFMLITFQKGREAEMRAKVRGGEATGFGRWPESGSRGLSICYGA